jgi:hypothetical protein
MSPDIGADGHKKSPEQIQGFFEFSNLPIQITTGKS